MAHHTRRNREKVGATLPAGLFLLDESQVGFVYQRRRLQSVIRALLPQLTRGYHAQLLVNQRKEIGGGLRLTSGQALQYACDFCGRGLHDKISRRLYRREFYSLLCGKPIVSDTDPFAPNSSLSLCRGTHDSPRHEQSGGLT